MERLEFIVDIEGWKSFYRTKFSGDKEKLFAFTSLVEGTCQMKLGALFPKMKEVVETLDEKEFEPVLKEVNKLAKRVVKAGEVSKDFKKFALMWATKEILMKSGLKLCPEKREIKSTLKKI